MHPPLQIISSQYCNCVSCPFSPSSLLSKLGENGFLFLAQFLLLLAAALAGGKERLARLGRRSLLLLSTSAIARTTIQTPPHLFARPHRRGGFLPHPARHNVLVVRYHETRRGGESVDPVGIGRQSLRLVVLVIFATTGFNQIVVENQRRRQRFGKVVAVAVHQVVRVGFEIQFAQLFGNGVDFAPRQSAGSERNGFLQRGGGDGQADDRRLDDARVRGKRVVVAVQHEFGVVGAQTDGG